MWISLYLGKKPNVVIFQGLRGHCGDSRDECGQQTFLREIKIIKEI